MPHVRTRWRMTKVGNEASNKTNKMRHNLRGTLRHVLFSSVAPRTNRNTLSYIRLFCRSSCTANAQILSADSAQIRKQPPHDTLVSYNLSSSLLPHRTALLHCLSLSWGIIRLAKNTLPGASSATYGHVAKVPKAGSQDEQSKSGRPRVLKREGAKWSVKLGGFVHFPSMCKKKPKKTASYDQFLAFIRLVESVQPQIPWECCGRKTTSLSHYNNLFHWALWNNNKNKKAQSEGTQKEIWKKKKRSTRDSSQEAKSS